MGSAVRRDPSAGEQFDWLPNFISAASSDTGVMQIPGERG